MIYGQANRMGGEYDTVVELVNRYNNGELDISRKEANQLARKASQYGLEFNVESRPISKGLFDLVDTAAFGMVPNEWRPESAGQDYYGESGIDKFAGGVGSIGGLLTGIGGAIKYGPKAIAYGVGAARDSSLGAASMSAGKNIGKAVANMKENIQIQKAQQYAQNLYNKGQNVNPFNVFPGGDVGF